MGLQGCKVVRLTSCEAVILIVRLRGFQAVRLTGFEFVRL